MKDRMRIFFAALFLLAANTISFAQTDSQLTSAAWSDGAVGESNDRPLYQAASHVKGERTDAQVFWWDSYGRFRFDKKNPSAPVLGYRWATINFDSDSNDIPDHLDDMSMALGLHLSENFALVSGVGYATNSPFSDPNGIYGIGHLIFQKQLNQKDTLQLSLDYDGNSVFLPDLPLPGFQWVHRENPISYGIGFPNDFLTWEITPKLRFDATYTFPYTTRGQFEYHLTQHVSLFAGAANFFDGFELHDRPGTDRLFYQLSRGEGGVRYVDTIFGMYVDVALAIGYAFDQNFDRGFDMRDLDHQASLTDAPYVGLTIIGRL
jgi:hypothetical protein